MRTHTTTIRNLVLLAVLGAAPLVAPGCGGGSDDSGPAGGAPAAGPAPSQPSRDFSAEAKEQIDEQNMGTELESLKSEVESDR